MFNFKDRQIHLATCICTRDVRESGDGDDGDDNDDDADNGDDGNRIDCDDDGGDGQLPWDSNLQTKCGPGVDKVETCTG